MLQVVEQEMLSAVPQVSRYTQMQLFDLEVKSPRVRAVKRLFLGSLTQHRYHLPSQCPRPPCNHFAPAPSHFPSSSLRQLMFAEDGHKAVIIVHRLAVPVYSSIEVIKILLYRSLARWE